MNGLIEHIPLIMGLVSFCGGVATWYGASVKKNYAAERDFGHLRRNYENLTANVAALSAMGDERFDRLDLQLAKQEALLQSILSRRGGNASNPE